MNIEVFSDSGSVAERAAAVIAEETWSAISAGCAPVMASPTIIHLAYCRIARPGAVRTLASLALVGLLLTMGDTPNSNHNGRTQMGRYSLPTPTVPILPFRELSSSLPGWDFQQAVADQQATYRLTDSRQLSD